MQREGQGRPLSYRCHDARNERQVFYYTPICNSSRHRHNLQRGGIPLVKPSAMAPAKHCTPIRCNQWPIGCPSVISCTSLPPHPKVAGVSCRHASFSSRLHSAAMPLMVLRTLSRCSCAHLDETAGCQGHTGAMGWGGCKEESRTKITVAFLFPGCCEGRPPSRRPPTSRRRRSSHPARSCSRSCRSCVRQLPDRRRV